MPSPSAATEYDAPSCVLTRPSESIRPFLLEAVSEAQFVVAPDASLRQNFDGDFAIQAGLPSLVNGSHASASENGTDLVLRQQLLEFLRAGRLPAGRRIGLGHDPERRKAARPAQRLDADSVLLVQFS